MTEQAIIYFHVIVGILFLFLAIVWASDDFGNILLKMVFYVMLFWNIGILAAWFGLIKVI